MAKKPRFTLKQHEALGRELQEIQNKLSRIETSLFSAYPISSRVPALAGRAVESVRALRYRLDDLVCQENTQIPDIGQRKIYLRGSDDQ